MQLAQALRVRAKDVIAFVGGGGKTTAMFRLADELAARNQRVITTTTTRIFAAQIKFAPHHLRYDPQVADPPAPQSVAVSATDPAGLLRGAIPSGVDFLPRLGDWLAAHPHTLVIGAESDDGKALGVPPGLVDELIALDAVDAVIYEADGSRMRPFKAPASHEPVLADSTTVLVPVVGVSVVGTTLDDAHVHRAETVARLASARIGETITPEIVARVIAHPKGGLKNKPRAARVVVLINQVENDSQVGLARGLARLLLAEKEIDAVAIGAVRDPQRPIRETHRRVAAIVTAAGAGVRMPGRVKQLLPWRGQTLIENAVQVATQSSVRETVVVLGAHAQEIRAVIRDAHARVVINREWETGHASSLRAGLNALSPNMDAAIFINADQPMLTASIVDAIIQRCRETDASIVAPLYAGKRGSPVLFDRVHFEELKTLTGEQGGRELIAKYSERVERVEFADARAGFDVDTPEDYAGIQP